MRYFGERLIHDGSELQASLQGGSESKNKTPSLPSLSERILNRLFKKKEIVNCDRDTYLHRWYVIRKTGFGLFIHKFVRSDEDRALHDHPWPFIVIPIWRGYIEHSDRQCRHCIGVGWEPVTFGLGPMACAKCDVPFSGRVNVMRRVWPIIGTRFRRGTYKHRVELLKGDDTICPECGWDKFFKIDDYPNIQQCTECGHPCDVIERELPAWSIFIRFKEFREWGFHLPEGWVQWNKFWQDKCE